MEGKSPLGTETRYGRRGLGQHKRPRNRAKSLVKAPDNCIGRLIWRIAILNGLKPKEKQALVQGTTVKAGATNHFSTNHIRLAGNDLSHLAAHLHGGIEGSLGGQLNNAKAIALIFVWHKAGGYGNKGKACKHHPSEQHSHYKLAEANCLAQHHGIGLRQALKKVIKSLEDWL